MNNDIKYFNMPVLIINEVEDSGNKEKLIHVVRQFELMEFENYRDISSTAWILDFEEIHGTSFKIIIVHTRKQFLINYKQLLKDTNSVFLPAPKLIRNWYKMNASHGYL